MKFRILQLIVLTLFTSSILAANSELATTKTKTTLEGFLGFECAQENQEDQQNKTTLEFRPTSYFYSNHNDIKYQLTYSNPATFVAVTKRDVICRSEKDKDDTYRCSDAFEKGADFDKDATFIVSLTVKPRAEKENPLGAEIQFDMYKDTKVPFLSESFSQCKYIAPKTFSEFSQKFSEKIKDINNNALLDPAYGDIIEDYDISGFDFETSSLTVVLFIGRDMESRGGSLTACDVNARYNPFTDELEFGETVECYSEYD